MTTASRDAADAIRTQNHDALSALPFSDTRDFEDANRGLIAPIEEQRYRLRLANGVLT